MSEKPAGLIYTAIAEKLCRRCGQVKPASEMKRDTRYAGGLSSYCKLCHQAASVAWQRANPERLNATRKIRYHKNRDKINAQRKRLYNKESVRWKNLLRLYRMTRDQYQELLDLQSGACAICGRDQHSFSRPLAVDHDHNCCSKAPTCGECNRGLLCHHCNTALHLLERDGWIGKAMSYIGGAQ